MKCNGKNCNSTDGKNHSFECRREHIESVKSGIKSVEVVRRFVTIDTLEMQWPDPYASIQIDIDTGITVVDAPSHKTVEVYTRNQVEAMISKASVERQNT